MRDETKAPFRPHENCYIQINFALKPLYAHTTHTNTALAPVYIRRAFFERKMKKLRHRNHTYCPSNVIGGVTFHRWIAFILLMSTIWRRTSGLFVPGVGYRTDRVSGNVLPPPPPPKPWTVITAPVANHGYVIVPTFVSSNDANIMCVPSSELQIASGVANISSAMCDRATSGQNRNYYY